MSNSTKSFNIIDIIIILGIVLIALSSVIQGFAVRRFEEKNSIKDTVITLRLLNVDDIIVDDIEKGDYIFSDVFSNDDSIGVIEQKLKHSLTNNQHAEGDGEIVEYEIQILGKCIKNSNGFYSLYNKMIIPGMSFSADNGFVGFECEVISVKSVD